MLPAYARHSGEQSHFYKVFSLCDSSGYSFSIPIAAFLRVACSVQYVVLLSLYTNNAKT